jgi:ABC-2 type transport system permease protein
MSETAAVMWKEWTEIFNQGMKWRDWLVALMFLAIFGVFSPWLHGSMWLSPSLFLFTYGFLAGAVAAVPTIESFAGERERHTLETLLATPLSDRAIFLGKYIPAVLYGWGLVLMIVAVGLVSVNLFHGQGDWLFYRPVFALWILLIPLLAAGLYAAVGIFISLRAPTLRQASQTLGMSIVVILVLPFIFLALLPDRLAARFVSYLGELDTDRLFLAFAMIMLILDVVLVAAGIRRFRRGRVALD